MHPPCTGIAFSDFPSTCAGIAVLTRARVQSANIWFFLEASWEGRGCVLG